MTTASMIDIKTLNNIPKAFESAKIQIKSEVPNATYVPIGADGEYIYFNVVAKVNNISSCEIRNLKETTRFEVIEENIQGVYKGEFKMKI